MFRRLMALSLGCALLASAPAHAQIEEKKFNVIGTWNFINMWKKSEFPFWSEQIMRPMPFTSGSSKRYMMPSKPFFVRS